MRCKKSSTNGCLGIKSLREVRGAIGAPRAAFALSASRPPITHRRPARALAGPSPRTASPPKQRPRTCPEALLWYVWGHRPLVAERRLAQSKRWSINSLARNYPGHTTLVWMATSSASYRVRAFKFIRIPFIWLLTVLSAMRRRPPISRLVRFLARRRMICRSRFVNPLP
jgi:hypothetical protein